MPERNWVFDTVSLSNFLLAEAGALLDRRYRKRGVVTWEVYGELSSGMTSFPRLKRIDRFIDEGVFRLCSLSGRSRKTFTGLIADLGKGEASCLAFAMHKKATVVTDDRVARKRCTQMNLPFTGTLGILKASVLDGQISLEQADRILKKMTQAGFYSPVRGISEIT